MPLFIIALGVAILVLLIVKLKLNTFVALIIVSTLVGLLLGIPITKINTVIENGIGSQLGSLAIVFGLGAMLGRLIADSGAGYRIAMVLNEKFGRRQIEWAIVLASFIIGLALFFEVGLVVLLPIVFVIANELGIAMLYLAIPMAAALNVAHAFLPPHPDPVAIAAIFNAPLGHVLVLGILAAIPTVIITGPVYNHVLHRLYPSAYHIKTTNKVLGDYHPFELADTPGFGISIVTATMPIILIAGATISKYLLSAKTLPDQVIQLIGSPDSAMLLSLLLAIYTLGIRRHVPMKRLGQSMRTAVEQIAMMLFIIGGGGAFKQVLVTGGVAKYVATLFSSVHWSPIIAAWIMTAVLRVCIGSTTVAALTGAGLAVPLMQATGVNPALMVLAVGAGSVFCDHVNGAGFWMIKQYFDLSLKETLLTWTPLTMLMSVVGLGCVLGLSLLF
ncbi:gluconate permease [Lactiplantibacillus pentosus]|uniref:gluconate:H+ symporter n=1 Tax=Lactiplantibacillus pentosus TaxID=1589 RepID=UPI0021A2C700|nr:gluconate:H+ symporter [Lactiplantibacillus pentosus]MCT3298850.1 gluconate permease [Lactiplantibacillus pentosus]